MCVLLRRPADRRRTGWPFFYVCRSLTVARKSFNDWKREPGASFMICARFVSRGRRGLTFTITGVPLRRPGRPIRPTERERERDREPSDKIRVDDPHNSSLMSCYVLWPAVLLPPGVVALHTHTHTHTHTPLPRLCVCLCVCLRGRRERERERERPNPPRSVS